jgi:hypothetical protein
MAEPDYTADAASDGDAMPEQGGLDRKLKAWFRADLKHHTPWRKLAREDFAFYAGDQWSDDDKRQLAEQMRPALTFNRVAPLVNAIVGSEINNRREVRYMPREQGDAQANEVLTAAAEWFRDECGAEDEESDGFKDAVICGMGWADTRLDFDDDPNGAPAVEHIPALEMVPDCYAQKANLTDAQRLFRVRKDISYADAVELTGEKDRSKLSAKWAQWDRDQNEPHDQDAADIYDGSQGGDDRGYEKEKYTLIEARWIERETFHRGPDIFTGEEREYSAKELGLVVKAFPDFEYITQTRKVVRRAFIGSEVLGKPDQIMAPRGMFGWECITGYRDKVKGQFYGIVRAAKDPQRWSNKFFSQVQYLLNSQAKGGVAAERGAVENEEQFEASWAKSDAVTWLNPGSLSGDKPKIQPKPAAQFPAGFWTLFQEAKEEISQVTGLSPEFIGTREVDQAGVLEYQRRQSSLNLLAELFNSLRRYRKRQGRVMLHLIQHHLADGRLVRIVGDDLKQYVPLTKEAVADKQYDIIVDDSPTSPNEKDRTWQILMQMLPIVKDMLTPEVALELLTYSPLPNSFVEKMKQKAQEAAQQPKPPTPEEQKLMLEREKHQMTMQGKQADLQMDMQGKQAELAMDQQRNEMDLEMSAIDLMIKQREAQMKMALDQQKLQNDRERLAIQAQANAVARQNANSKQTSAASR